MSLLRDARAVIVERFRLEDALRRSSLGGQQDILELGIQPVRGPSDGIKLRLAECFLLMRDLDRDTVELLRLRYASCLGGLAHYRRIAPLDDCEETEHLASRALTCTILGDRAGEYAVVEGTRRTLGSYEEIAHLRHLTESQVKRRIEGALARIQDRMDALRESADTQRR